MRVTRPQSNADADCVDRKDIQPRLKPLKARSDRAFDPTKYTTHSIALKFAYLGQRYNGFEYHSNNATPLPTIEEELWKALKKARLIFPQTGEGYTAEDEPNWNGCEYSKCGRTDRGVSAFGQVVAIRVRSNRPVSRPASDTEEEKSSVVSKPSEFHPIHDELPYCRILNRLLPPDIRMLAWSPTPSVDFSARFSCRERRYEYYFTQPAFAPTREPSPSQNGWLDIEAMRIAAKKFEGLHDFRNFCKVDASKQIENFERRIFFSDIQPLTEKEQAASFVHDPSFREPQSSSDVQQPSSHPAPAHSPYVYVFRLHGSAFLWHQVRHMIAILFLIGQKLESPSLVDELLKTTANPRKPQYEMADDAPLVLRDCIFPDTGSESREDAIEWIYVGSDEEEGVAGGDGRQWIKKAAGAGKPRPALVIEDMWRVWRARKIDEILSGALLNVLARQGSCHNRSGGGSQKVYQGGNCARLAGKYIPVMQRPKLDPVDVINSRFLTKQAQEDKDDMESDCGSRR